MLVKEDVSLIVLTSPRAAAILVETRLPNPGIRLAVIGDSTARVLDRAHLNVSIKGDGSGVLSLVEAISSEVRDRGKTRVLHLRSRIASRELSEELARRGVDVVEVDVYTTIPRIPSETEWIEASRDLDAACFASPSAVRVFSDVAGPDWIAKAATRFPVIATGKTTAKAIQSAGLRNVHVADEASPLGLARKVRDVLLEHR